MPGNEQVKSEREALEIAREFASLNNQDEVKAESYAEAWYHAGKDFDVSTPADLRSYLARRFGIE